LIDYCLTSSKQYFSYIQYDNKINNNKKNYVEMGEGMGQWLLTASEKVLRVG
jgi:ABC-type tungstate transport system permease subunit